MWPQYYAINRSMQSTCKPTISLCKTIERSLPCSSPLSALPQMFAKFFADKISKLHLNLQYNSTSTPAHFFPSSPVLHHFTPATLSEISDLFSQSSNSHCNLDPIPTTVLKKIANEIALQFSPLSSFPFFLVLSPSP